MAGLRNGHEPDIRRAPQDILLHFDERSFRSPHDPMGVYPRHVVAGEGRAQVGTARTREDITGYGQGDRRNGRGDAGPDQSSAGDLRDIRKAVDLRRPAREGSMIRWVRLWEKLRGIPHQEEDSQRVSDAAVDLKGAASDARNQMRRFLDTDPIAATALWLKKGLK